jgi:hypothetical protein
VQAKNKKRDYLYFSYFFSIQTIKTLQQNLKNHSTNSYVQYENSNGQIKDGAVKREASPLTHKRPARGAGGRNNNAFVLTSANNKQ